VLQRHAGPNPQVTWAKAYSKPVGSALNIFSSQAMIVEPPLSVVCYQSMLESRRGWAAITEPEVESQLTRWIGAVQFADLAGPNSAFHHVTLGRKSSVTSTWELLRLSSRSVPVRVAAPAPYILASIDVPPATSPR
jgi:hypothetical protein